MKVQCQRCDGGGSIIIEHWTTEPCGHCAACERGDPAGCVAPYDYPVQEQTFCPDCCGEGVVEIGGDAKPRDLGTHTFLPHSKYPWFCDKCGYAEHEQLQHGAGDGAGISDKRTAVKP